ncbi:Putative E3 ubiquitin-protein ligase RING1a [Zea mays]|uniref:Putative E3 ubiquitin-protein ligase RING1a n=1 Tax=Zea mays TaxID=4577 RepID=A0A1D6FSN6_MAIZE|nr:Putative E3 ubiquitin-protein ligase RING1a [Zea mays]
MPAQKRPLPSSASPGSDADVEEAPGADADGCGGADQRSPKVTLNGVEERDGGPLQAKDQRHDSDADDEEEGDREGGGGGDGSGSGGDDDCDSQSSQSDGVMDEFTLVKLVDVRKEVQCPICLGIIRKTRTVMECLHRFCRDCIDKSMRLGNNECPACRTHCASRRSLRDDPNYDALILALYPDIDKYEEEELAFSEEERTRNKRIQESIAETFRRQTEALVKKRSTVKATDAASTRKTRRNMRPRRRGRISSPDIAPTDFDDDDREENGDDGSKESSSVDDHSPDVRPKRSRRWPMPRRSPAKAIGNTDNSIEDNDDSGGARDFMTASPLRGEMLAWGKNGTRSQTRHGNSSGSSGRMGRSGRVAKLVDQFRNADDFDNENVRNTNMPMDTFVRKVTELNLYLVLLPLDGQSVPKLEKPYLSCLPTLSVRHLCQELLYSLKAQGQG